ncbi:MAG: hypothetical protein LAT81_03795 [Oceanicaulis sp.]|nr:hypothetical protein [Oceanicaulis sp.]
MTPRLTGLAGASLIHVIAIAGLIALPPVVNPPDPAPQSSGPGAFYIFLAEGADSDAPLFEPPLAALGGDPDGAPGDGEGEGSGSGEGDGDGDAAGAESVSDPEAETDIIPETETETPPETADDPETAPDVSEMARDDTELAPDDPTGVVLEPAQSGDRPVDSAPRPAPSAADRTPSVPAPAPDPADASAPVATLQPRRAEAGSEGEPELDIDALMAQMAISLDPDDYRMIQGAVASRLVVRDSFCLSSSDANREAGGCPEDGPASEIDLASFGLTGFGAIPPRFLEDMSRLEFELAQMGAGAGQIRRILAELADARRTVINQPAVTREMDRIAGDRTDPQGFRAPITPQRARDPSGEP